MSRSPDPRRSRVPGLGIVGLGAIAVLAGTTATANAAEDLVVPLAPNVEVISAFPLENRGSVLDPMADPYADVPLTPVPVEYGDTLTVHLPPEALGATMDVSLYFDNDQDGVTDEVFSTGTTGANPLHVDGLGTDTLTITLPTDDEIDVSLAYLGINSSRTQYSAGINLDPTEYLLEFGSAALDPVTLEPPLFARGYEACETADVCTVAAGSTLTLNVPVGSLLQEIGITDLTDATVALQPFDAAHPAAFATPVPLSAQVSADAQTATVVVPAGTAAGAYQLLVAQPHVSGASVVYLSLNIVDDAAAAVVAAPTTPAPAPSTPVTALNPGLRSNTGVQAVPTGSGTVAGTTGAALLALAGVGGVAVLRTRRRPAVDGGSSDA